MVSGAQEPSGWRVPILAQFSPEIAAVARLTIVADPDELLTEPGAIEGIRNQGFEITPFDDHVTFRYAYERRFRQIWDTGATTNLVVVLRASQSTSTGFPSISLSRQSATDVCCHSAWVISSRPSRPTCWANWTAPIWTRFMPPRSYTSRAT